MKDYNNLIELLLGPIRQRPGMYLGAAKISNLLTFVSGYMICADLYRIDDPYFGDKGFNEWYFSKHNLIQPSSWTLPFLEKANDDEQKALEFFFEALEEFQEATTK